MSEATRQARRREQRERFKAGTALISSRGLRQVPAPADLVAVATVVLGKLRESENTRRASEAAEIAQRLAEASLAASPPRVKIACTKGCSYCCHTFVAITAPEAFRLAGAVRSAKARLDPAEIRRRAETLIGLSPQARIGAKLPCPLLIDGACSVYAERPLVCRQATSLDLAACLDEFEGRNPDAAIPISQPHLAHSSNAHVTLLAALKAAALPMAPIELGTALAIALDTPDGEARWLAGENIFAGAAQLSTRTGDVERVVTHIAALIAA